MARRKNSIGSTPGAAEGWSQKVWKVHVPSQPTCGLSARAFPTKGARNVELHLNKYRRLDDPRCRVDPYACVHLDHHDGDGTSQTRRLLLESWFDLVEPHRMSHRLADYCFIRRLEIIIMLILFRQTRTLNSKPTMTKRCKPNCWALIILKTWRPLCARRTGRRLARCRRPQLVQLRSNAVKTRFDRLQPHRYALPRQILPPFPVPACCHCSMKTSRPQRKMPLTIL